VSKEPKLATKTLFSMHPRKRLEITSWLRVIAAVVFLLCVGVFYLDYRSAVVEWRAGRVVGKTWSPGWNGRFFSDNRRIPPEESRCYINVDLEGLKGQLTVSRWTYSDFEIGQACEVAFRHGRLKDYVFDDIRRPPSEKRLP